MRWLWAAYRMGLWRELMDVGLTQSAFSDRMTEIISTANYDWIMEARGEEGNRPVGLIMATSLANGRAIEPFVEWFPWATTRNQVEATAVFLKVVSKRFKIFVFAHESAGPFWEKFIRHRMIRRGCKVIDHFARGEHATMYYTIGPD